MITACVETEHIIYRTLIKPLLFALPPERASKAGEMAFRVPAVWAMRRQANGLEDRRLGTTVAGIVLPGPVGAAAGIDKDCKFLGALLDIGFGFATGGTVTLAARPGNAKPRLLRVPARRALINALGFPGHGLESAEARMTRFSDDRQRLFASVAGTIEEEVLECHSRLQPHVAAVEVNISSPNTAGLRAFHEPARLRGLIEAIRAQKDRPVLIKLPPWAQEAAARRMALLLAETAIVTGADGLVIANSHPVEDSRLAVGRGGLSGAPLFDHTVRMVAETRAALPGVAIVGCGGVSSARDVWALIRAGANAVQLYTALVYEGPGLPARINSDLAAMMERTGVKSVAEIAGRPLE